MNEAQEKAERKAFIYCEVLSEFFRNWRPYVRSKRKLKKYYDLDEMNKDLTWSSLDFYEIDNDSKNEIGKACNYLDPSELNSFESIVRRCVSNKNKQIRKELEEIKKEAFKIMKLLKIGYEKPWIRIIVAAEEEKDFARKYEKKEKVRELEEEMTTNQIDDEFYLYDAFRSIIAAKLGKENKTYFENDDLIRWHNNRNNPNIIPIPMMEISLEKQRKELEKEFKEKYGLVTKDMSLPNPANRVRKNFNRIIELLVEIEMLNKKEYGLSLHGVDTKVFLPAVKYIEGLKKETIEKIKKCKSELNRIIPLVELDKLLRIAEKNDSERREKEEIIRKISNRISELAFEIEQKKHDGTNEVIIQKLEKELYAMMHDRTGPSVDVHAAYNEGVERYRKQDNLKKFKQIDEEDKKEKERKEQEERIKLEQERKKEEERERRNKAFRGELEVIGDPYRL